MRRTLNLRFRDEPLLSAAVSLLARCLGLRQRLLQRLLAFLRGFHRVLCGVQLTLPLALLRLNVLCFHVGRARFLLDPLEFVRQLMEMDIELVEIGRCVRQLAFHRLLLAEPTLPV